MTLKVSTATGTVWAVARVLFTIVAVYIAWQDDRMSPRSTYVIRALIADFESSVSFT